MSGGAIDVAALGAALRALAPPTVSTGALAVTAALVADLHPDEAALVATSVAKRRNEFATGRALLHRLLDTDQPILRGRAGAPDVPAGWTVTLAHDRDVAVAAATRDASVAALGIDVEPDTPLTADLAAVILGDGEGTIDAHLAFCLKEAVYKAWSATGGGMLDHHDVRLDLGPHRDSHQTFTGLVIGADVLFHGRYRRTAGRWLALVVA